MKKSFLGAGAIAIVTLGVYVFWFSNHEKTQNRQPEYHSENKKTLLPPPNISQPQGIDQKATNQEADSISAIYTNEQYGLKIVFPPEMSSFEKKETPLKSHRAYNPIYDIEFGKNKDDFFESMGQQHGNMLSVWVFDRKKCDDLELEKEEKTFCDENKSVSSQGSLRGFTSESVVKGIWFGNKNYLYYISSQQSGSASEKLLRTLRVELKSN